MGKTAGISGDKSLEMLNAKIDEVDVQILDPGQKGVLSIFGARDAKVRVTRRKSGRDIEGIVDEVMRIIMDCLDVSYRIFTEEQGDSIYINVETAGVDGLLIGRKGDTLNSLQHLIGRIVSKRMGGYQRLTLDVGGYLKNRYEILKQKAIKAADKARKLGREVALEPMKASERRIVHLTLANMEGVTTYTVGNGDLRKVYVSPVGSEGNRQGNR